MLFRSCAGTTQGSRDGTTQCRSCPLTLPLAHGPSALWKKPDGTLLLCKHNAVFHPAFSALLFAFVDIIPRKYVFFQSGACTLFVSCMPIVNCSTFHPGYVCNYQGPKSLFPDCPLSCLSAETGGAANGGRSLFILPLTGFANS